MATNPKRAKVVEQISTISSKYEFKWLINNFSTGSNEVRKSPIFTTMSDSGNIQWHIQLHPKDWKEGCKDYILGLFVNGINIPVKVTITLKLIRTLLKCKVQNVTTSTMKEIIFKPGSGGHPVCILRERILDAKYNIYNNNLTIVCELSPYVKEKKDDKSTSEEIKNKESVFVLEETLQERLKEFDKYVNLINDSKFSDVSLISLEGKELKAHKCILAKSSSVFATMFDVEMKEKHENKVKIEDIKYDVLQEMICFIYAGKVKNIDTNTGELAAAADKYALDGLKYICEETMCRNLNIDNVVESLKVADRYRMTKLKKEAIEFIVAHIDDVKDQAKFLFLPPNIMHDLWCVTAKKVKK